MTLCGKALGVSWYHGQNPLGPAAPFGFWPWAFPRDSIRHDTPLAFPPTGMDVITDRDASLISTELGPDPRPTPLTLVAGRGSTVLELPGLGRELGR